jgi:single-strand DNA-binding protein
MYNKIILAGNLTRDVEVRYTQSGSAIGNTAIATSRKFKSATGEQKEEVLFVDLTFFGRTAEIANQYLRKGSKVLVDGRLKLDQWTAQDGSKRSKHSVTVENLQMLGSKDDSQGYNAAPAGDTYSQPAQQQGYSAPSQPAPKQTQQQAAPTNIPEIDINEDEIPF